MVRDHSIFVLHLSCILFCLANLSYALLTSAGQTYNKHTVTSVLLLQALFPQVTWTSANDRKMSSSNSSDGHRWHFFIYHFDFLGENQSCAKPPSDFPQQWRTKWNCRRRTRVVVVLLQTCWQLDDARQSFLATTRVTTHTAIRWWYWDVIPAEPRVLNVNLRHSADGRWTCRWLWLSRSSSWRQALVNPTSFRRVLELGKFTLALCAPCKNDAVVKPVGLTLPELYHLRLDNVAPPVGEGQGHNQI